MPPRRHSIRKRIGTEAELDAWAECFETGCDFFGGLQLIGVDLTPTKTWRDPVYPAIVHSDRADVFRAAAEAAWTRLGAEHMRRRKPDDWGRDIPWALEQFGSPPGWQP
jgi:hypothetical protein